MKKKTEVLNLAAGRTCKACERGEGRLPADQARKMARDLPGWAYQRDRIEKTFRFRSHYEAMAFANAIAWISHQEDHHPELTTGYSTCSVGYSTHSVGGLTDNDFICARRVERLLAPD